MRRSRWRITSHWQYITLRNVIFFLTALTSYVLYAMITFCLLSCISYKPDILDFRHQNLLLLIFQGRDIGRCQEMSLDGKEGGWTFNHRHFSILWDPPCASSSITTTAPILLELPLFASRTVLESARYNYCLYQLCARPSANTTYSNIKKESSLPTFPLRPAHSLASQQPHFTFALCATNSNSLSLHARSI